jgi:hypothetical protein
MCDGESQTECHVLRGDLVISARHQSDECTVVNSYQFFSWITSVRRGRRVVLPSAATACDFEMVENEKADRR